jgi:hypothetical protein
MLVIPGGQPFLPIPSFGCDNRIINLVIFMFEKNFIQIIYALN